MVLAQSRRGVQGNIAPFQHRGGGLGGAAEVAGIRGVEGYVSQSTCQRAGLLLAAFGQGHVRMALDAPFPVPGGLTVSRYVKLAHRFLFQPEYCLRIRGYFNTQTGN